MTQEQKFLDALRDIFIGAPVEGDSGFINLMKIKSRYYQQAVFPQLLKDVDKATKPFEKSFREELFDKLYAFFNRYFSESGSIYFRHTPLHQNIYERVYTDDRDVMLFWKTHMLYYVKTDRLFQSMGADVDGEKFWFDVSALEHKRANEKRELTYTFQSRKADGTLVFTVAYSEKGRKTKIDELLRAIKETGVTLEEDTLLRAFRIFGKQSEVDYFINKNAKAFLKEQFDLWLYQYVFSGENAFTETRLKQLQAIKDVACHIIDFIAQFEDELVRVWNKPKFVLNSNYIITLDKIAARSPDLLARILKHKGMAAQVEEWRALGMVDEKFKPAEILQKDKLFDSTHSKYQFLPLDTRYFKELELDILSLFDDLDDALDGWLVHSENYQALNLFASKYRERVKCIHVDPPYNTATSGFLYTNAYRHSSWMTMMENRIATSTGLLSQDGSFLCHIDENEYERLYLIFEYLSIPDAGTIVWDKRNPMNAGRGIATQHEYIVWRSKQETPIYLRNESVLSMLAKAADILKKYGGPTDGAKKEYATWIDKNPQLTGGEKAYRFLDDKGHVYQSVSLRAPEPRKDPKFHKPLIHPDTNKPCAVPPNGFSRTPETLQDMIERGDILFGPDETIQPRQKVPLTKKTRRQISSIIQDARKGRADVDSIGLDFPYCHPVSLYEVLIGAAAPSLNDIVLDFFAGSGTTAHAVMNLNRLDCGHRKYILVEMGEQFNTAILPRVKKVAFSDKWKDGTANGGQGMSQFVKYYDLEQYEDTLRRARYQSTDAPLFQMTDVYSSYVFLRDLKLLDAVTLDKEADKIEVRPEALYAGIDLAETLSCVTGKWIKRITKDTVEFEDGTSASLSDPDWSLVKPLVWW